MCPPRLESKLLGHGKVSAYKSAQGGMVQTAGQHLMTMKTIDDSVLVAHDFDVAKQGYQPDVLIRAARNLTSSGCRMVDDDGSYIENKASRLRLAVTKRNNIYELKVGIVHDHSGAGPQDCAGDNEAMVLPFGADSSASHFGSEAAASADPAEEQTVKMDFEVQAVHYRKTPRQPTAEEIAQHEITHVPHRDWCRYCLGGRGRADRRLQLHGEDRLMPVLSFDPVFAGSGKTAGPPRP